MPAETTQSGLDLAVRAGQGRVVYQLDVAAFTPEGTWNAALRHLPYLVDLGVEAVSSNSSGSLDAPGRARWIRACLERGIGVLIGAPVDGGPAPAVTLDSVLAATAQHGGDAEPDAELSVRRHRLLATLMLTGPFTPVIRMGEEWSAGRPAGPDRARQQQPGHREMLGFYRRLIALHRAETPAHPSVPAEISHGDGTVLITRGDCVVVANLASRRRRVSVPPWPRSVLLASQVGVTLSADAVELPGESAAFVCYDHSRSPVRRVVQQAGAYS